MSRCDSRELKHNMQSSSAEASASTAFVPISTASRESGVKNTEKLERTCIATVSDGPSPPPPLTFLKCEPFREFLGSEKHTLSCHVHPSENNHEEALIMWTMFAKVSKASRECGWTKVSKAAADETFLKNLQNRVSSKKLPAKAILKVFPAEGEFVENFPRRKTFDIILFPQQAAAVLLRKLLNNSSLQALTGSGVKGNIGIYWHRSQNALEMFLVSAPQEI